jgi:hypothetical protein
MSISEELKQKVFNGNSRFLEKLSLSPYNTERAFFEIFAKEITKKLPNYRLAISVRFHQIISKSAKEPAEVLAANKEILLEKVCCPYYRERAYQNNCKNKQCFQGAFLDGNEVDALIVRDGVDFCFVEYERSRNELCENFMKLHWLRQLFSKPFESLLITKLTTVPRQEGDSTLDDFNKYLANAAPELDKLLGTWQVMEIVNLQGAERNRRLQWVPA